MEPVQDAADTPGIIELTEDELRAVTGFAAGCARRVLPLFERERPADARPRDAVDAADAFASGGRRTRALRQCAWAAFTAGRDTRDAAAAADAARAASHAAAAAYLHPRASAHQVKHVLGAAAHAARAEELSAGRAPESGERPVEDGATGTLEWARRHAPPAVRAVLRRLPPAPPGGGPVGALLRLLDADLRT
ncbi:putative immunity protein [Streptomyces sp. NPDC048566]|uniref:putative immunity protein n=1 Tax=Streptomyces sp. NPDC048566 TaxID=3365569 RepID=UPI0037109E3E